MKEKISTILEKKRASEKEKGTYVPPQTPKRVPLPKPTPLSNAKSESHKYKCEIGKKKYTFKTKKDMCSSIGISNKKAIKILGGQEDEKFKISLI